MSIHSSVLKEAACTHGHQSLGLEASAKTWVLATSQKKHTLRKTHATSFWHALDDDQGANHVHSRKVFDVAVFHFTVPQAFCTFGVLWDFRQCIC